MRLFETDFAYAMEKGAHVTLWSSQKLLFGRVRAQHKSGVAKAKAEQGEKRKGKYARNVLIADIVSVYILLCYSRKLFLFFHHYKKFRGWSFGSAKIFAVTSCCFRSPDVSRCIYVLTERRVRQ